MGFAGLTAAQLFRYPAHETFTKSVLARTVVVVRACSCLVSVLPSSLVKAVVYVLVSRAIGAALYLAVSCPRVPLFGVKRVDAENGVVMCPAGKRCPPRETCPPGRRGAEESQPDSTAHTHRGRDKL